MLEQPVEVVHILDTEYVSIYCPACNDIHGIRVGGPNAWTWNQSVYTPTFGPSVLATSGHHAAGHVKTDECWCTYNEAHPEEKLPFSCYRCHSYIENGMIRYLDDCSHAHKGKTLTLVAHPDTVVDF